jgi:hypothetical protein
MSQSFVALNQTKPYDHGEKYGDYVYIITISAETVQMCNFKPISMAINMPSNHNGFGKTYFPVKIDRCYKMIFGGKNIGDSMFEIVQLN